MEKINRIVIPHERMMAPNEILTDSEQTILRSELGKLMWIARIARPGAIYDASAAAQTFSTVEMIEFSEEENLFFGRWEVGSFIEEDFAHMSGFAYFKSKRKEANNANISKHNKIDT